VYGLATAPSNVERLFELKRRPPDKHLQLLVPDGSWLGRVGAPGEAAIALAEAFWPGPLTLVVAAGPHAPPWVVVDGTIGVRVPAHRIALELLDRAGPLAASSANRSGQATPATAAEIRGLFGAEVDAYLEGGRIEGTGSTVVDLTGPELRILRAGAVAQDEVERALRGSI
jgi:L-threonylcarbamoyladenylate synthase